MSLIRAFTAASRVPRALLSCVAVRFNSTSKASKQPLLAEIYPLNKDSITEKDLDNWIDAVKQLKSGKASHETPKKSIWVN